LSKQDLILHGEKLVRRITEVEDLPGGRQLGRVAVRGVCYQVQREWPTGDGIWRPVRPVRQERTLVEAYLDDLDDELEVVYELDEDEL